jgi:hypothetical protein
MPCFILPLQLAVSVVLAGGSRSPKPGPKASDQLLVNTTSVNIMQDQLISVNISYVKLCKLT